MMRNCSPASRWRCCKNPRSYNSATALLNAALDDSFDRDPIWGATLPDQHMILTARAGEAKARKSAAKPAKGEERREEEAVMRRAD